MSDVRGIVFDVQRAAYHDGPGLRTVVFLKGCPLRCPWCHNPESQRLTPEQRTAADGSAKTVGREMGVGEVMDIVRRDDAFYRSSGGGMTISGGEPMMQPEFAVALLSAARDAGVHTCLDTSGAVSADRLRRTLPYTDLYHFDYKITGDAEHRAMVGAPADLVLDNLRMLAEAGARIQLRCPIITGVNDTAEHFDAIKQLRDTLQLGGVELLPYHDAGVGKWRDEATVRFRLPQADEVARWNKLVG
ncbi:MAG: radical SAM protein [Planctomycetota bacterium]